MKAHLPLVDHLRMFVSPVVIGQISWEMLKFNNWLFKLRNTLGCYKIWLVFTDLI